MKPQDSLVFSLLAIIMLVVMAFTPNPDFTSTPAGWALYGVVLGLIASIAIRSAITLRKKKATAKRRRIIISSAGSEHSKYQHLDTVYLGKENEPYDIEKEVENPWKEKK